MSGPHVLIIPAGYPTPDVPYRGRFVQDQARALQSQGARVGVLYAYTRSLRNIQNAERGPAFSISVANDAGINVYIAWRWATERTRFSIAYRATKSMLRRYMEDQGRPDLIHAHFARPAGQVAAELATELGIPLAITEHSSDFMAATAPQLNPKLIDVYDRAALTIAVSEALAERLPTKREIAVIPNVVDTDFFVPPDLPRPISTRLVSVGSLIARKRHHLAIQLIARLGPEYSLTLLGSGPLRPTLAKQAEGLGVQDRVHFIPAGDADRARRAMHRSSFLLSLSSAETFGMTVAEGMSTGMPAVVTNSGGPPEVVAGDAGSVAVRDVGAAATWLQTSVWAQQTGEYAEHRRKLIIERFSPGTVGASLIDHYSRVI